MARRRRQVWVTAATLSITILGLALFAIYLPSAIEADPIMLSLFLLLHLLFSQVSLRLSKGAPLSPALPIGASSFFVLGPGPALLVAAPGVLLRWARAKRPVWELFWGLARISIALLLTNTALTLLGSISPSFMFPRDLLVVIAVFGVYEAGAMLMTAIRRTITRQEPLLHGLMSTVRYKLVGLPFTVGCVVMTTILSLERGWFGLLLSTLPIIAVHKLFALSAEVHKHKTMALTDSLTGAFNQRYFWQWLENEGVALQNTNAPIAFLVIDVDRLKMLNDNFGHNVGDDALRTISAVLKEWTRRGDLVIRYGGDEFVVVLPGADPTQAEVIRQRIQEALKNAEVRLGPTRTVPISASVGLACYPRDGSSLQELFTRADAAMYARKQLRRSRAE